MEGQGHRTSCGVASRFRVGVGEVIGGTEDSSKPSSRLEDNAVVLLADTGTQLEERENLQLSFSLSYRR